MCAQDVASLRQQLDATSSSLAGTVEQFGLGWAHIALMALPAVGVTVLLVRTLTSGGGRSGLGILGNDKYV